MLSSIFKPPSIPFHQTISKASEASSALLYFVICRTVCSLMQNEFPKTFAILKNDESLNSKELLLLEQKYFAIKNEIIELKGIHKSAV